MLHVDLRNCPNSTLSLQSQRSLFPLAITEIRNFFLFTTKKPKNHKNKSLVIDFTIHIFKQLNGVGCKLTPNVETVKYLINCFHNGENCMGTNTGDDGRKGAVKGRKQVFNPKTEKWVKIDTTTGKFVGVKKDGEPYKGVSKGVSKGVRKKKK